jgi:DNA-binding NtrC family response regulator
MRDKILIVDDDEFVLACFERLLARQFDIETVSGPHAALEAIQERGPFAVVLSDLRMPGMDGVQLLQRVKELSPNTVGIVLSGNVDARDIESCAVYKVLDKPCPTSDLTNTLIAAIGHHHELSRTD